MITDKPLLVFDVESIGLHGEAFAVGFVVVEPANEWQEVLSGLYSCPIEAARGLHSDYVWVKDHVRIHLPSEYRAVERLPVDTPSLVRAGFWGIWREWAERGALLCADTPWPVEANFLSQCIDDLSPTANWEGPYPLIDITSICKAVGLESIERLPGELPEHNPLQDARHSVRCLRLALERVK